MTSKTRSKVTAGLLVVAVAICLLAGSEGAHAKRRRRPVAPPVSSTAFTVRYVQRSIDAAPRAATTLVAPCPAGSLVVGGGASFNGAATEGPLGSSSPIPVSGSDLGRGFSARVHNYEATPERFVVTAICGSGGEVNVEYVRQSVTVPATKAGSISAQCPPGKSLTGGGASFDAPDLGQLNTSSGYPTGGSARPTGWFASVNNDTDAPHELFVTAICVSGVDLTYVERSFTVNPKSTNVGTVACPTGTKVLGGGAALAGSPVMYGYLSTSSPIGTPTPDDGFYTEASSAADGPTTLIVHAACASAV